MRGDNLICALNLKKHRCLIVSVFCLILCCIFINHIAEISNLKAVFSEQNTFVDSYKDMKSFFSAFGHEAERLPSKTETIFLPETPTEAFISYNKLQKPLGLSLVNFRGTKIKRYSFVIKNHKESIKGTVFGNLLVHKNRIIGGDITLPNGDITGIKQE